jgi:hypothetical protein
MQGRIQDFKLGWGGTLKKLRRAEGGAKMFRVFHVKNDKDNVYSGNKSRSLIWTK